MAGTKIKDEFKELVSPFLKSKFIEAKNRYGEASKEFQALKKQYIKNNLEKIIDPSFEKSRHYQSGLKGFYDNKPLVGLERLYKKTILIEPTTVCAAHCRWCLRGQYPVETMRKDDITNAVKYIGSEERKNELDEILITGGDPLMSLPLLDFTISEIKKFAKNIKIIRVASRVPFQDPSRINEKMLEIFSKNKEFRFELGTHINHPIEFWDESIEAIKKLQSVGFRIYNQNPLLKGVNDNFETLSKLYQLLRDYDIENHYLFHAIPLRGMSHHRTSLKRGLDLVNQLSSCGEFSGRAKPKYSVLSDIGKIIIYHDTIIKKDYKNNSLLLKSGFRLEDRIKWNPSWQKPDTVELDSNGYMNVWYLDGTDEDMQENFDNGEKVIKFSK